ncbi:MULTISPECIES: peptidoglycan DD-metalloendopeptidase family protein [unclassified Variovorax]|uniref:peptidoglycan DD-metalloendopeptidase family protein n=1 Tax=unclassified Variovorax TaxID=663243 RepID=UPI001F0C897B|nr:MULTISPECIES: peptidoglycan DD-metalloendopeptidase family protein [unclassified Variovorax]
MVVVTGRNWRAGLVLSAALLVAACSTSPKAPVAGPGEYVVQPGDTLYRIASKAGRSPGDIARWNNLQDPDKLEAGQVLRVVPPGGAASSSDAPPPRSTGAERPERPERARPPRASAPEPVAPPASRRSDWAWPAPGQVIAGFNGTSSKGIDIGGNAGDPVASIGAGKVAVTETLRGYGSVVMVDHGGSYMSVYTNLRTVLVKQGQQVKQGQKIAEIGNSDGGRARLHFEIRYRGNAVDPRQYLPAR